MGIASSSIIPFVHPPKPLWSPEALRAGFHLHTGETAIPDFIQDYVRYADVIEAPQEAHQAVAISLLAATLNEKVYIKIGSIKTSLDLWVVILSGSGLGRNTLVDLSRPVLEEAGLSNLLVGVTWGSREAFYQDIAERSSGLFLWPEISIVLKTLKDARFAGVKEWITDRFDSWNVPDTITYRQTRKKTDTPPIEFSQAPRLNLLATSSYDWFVGNLEQQDSTGGFIPRWILVKVADPTKLIPMPQATDAQLIKPLGDHLCKAKEIEGEADLSQVKDVYVQWYRATHQRFAQQQNKALAMSYFNRLRVQVLKLAVVYEVSRSLTLDVSPEAMERAIETTSKIEQTIFELLPTGMSHEGSEVDKIAARIKAAGADGLLRSELTRAFQSMQARDRWHRISTLVEGATIFQFERATSGRPAIVLVHRDSLANYKHQHPQDKEKD